MNRTNPKHLKQFVLIAGIGTREFHDTIAITTVSIYGVSDANICRLFWHWFRLPYRDILNRWITRCFSAGVD